MPIYLPTLNHDLTDFPAVHNALTDPDGLLAMGGDLSPQRLLNAYQRGIFPWFEEDQPILWWSPSQRMVLNPGDMHISRSLRKSFRRQNFTLSINHAFAEVIESCAQPRDYASDTWITDTMQDAYLQLHDMGFAHSIEVWQDGLLVGGLYGIYIGGIFCGESMFHTVTDASKIAFVGLQQHLGRIGCKLIDCQLHNEHLASLGATEISREAFINQLNKRNPTIKPQQWQPQALVLHLISKANTQGTTT
ncbi:leucyl/phenylalanyl-tRNA--protein transferase [Moritella sp. F3]|uniref:leucyl/phenylalanyl-tRNA--protein transferase n=1 Tax=Moritella sp. F3 TaxID=2718882 RepID=UPI0018E1AF56|nr:leucyl/phenylalanyl-tRNA--protein transferase [Moritella sp. F3]GIC76525.1 leucyl/phenylalanyl-tRNA--protein transferase [Moritella sp. F1]GIC81722.1 leucyl/phenylalanyl-tRNA--protein transferase [Moritella sp. F3]